MDKQLEKQVISRARNCCEYCLTPQQYEDLPAEIDHIIAEVHGGPTIASNLALSRAQILQGSILSRIAYRDYFILAFITGRIISVGMAHTCRARRQSAGQPFAFCKSIPS